MPWRRAKLLVALDAASVTGAVVSCRSEGLRVGDLARVSLAPGAVAAAPVESNLPRLDEVREALASVRRSLGANGRRATLILPDGIARLALLAPPPGVVIGDYARFRLGQGLPYPAAEAVVDSLPLGEHRFLCAAVRRGVVESYENAVRGAGFNLDRVDLAPLAAVGGLLRQRTPGERGTGLVVTLGDVALSIATFQEGALSLFRNRRRDPGASEAAWLQAELARTLGVADGAGDVPIEVLGPDAPAVAEGLLVLGSVARASAEPSWLGAALS